MLLDNPCTLCPRDCNVNRNSELGFCQCGSEIKIARAALHFWEEPCISGSSGSGTVFFSGCTMKCCYCQNHEISGGGFGKEISIERLCEIFLELQEKGAHNINLVTPTQYLPSILKALKMARPSLHIPIVFNSGGYEKVETIKELKDYIDIYLVDLKYFSSELSYKYSNAKDYFPIASAAIKEMIAEIGNITFDDGGIMQRGVIIRHLLLPGARSDSFKLLEWIQKELPRGKYLLSLMSQYTPPFENPNFKELNHRITTLEYDSLIKEAVRLGLTDGFMQQKSSAKKEYTPPFDLEGV